MAEVLLVVDDRSKPVLFSETETAVISLRKMRGQRISRDGRLSGRRSTRKVAAAAAPCDTVEIDVRDKLEINSSGDASSSQNFSIRDYVSTVRSNDIRKNWPFSQKYLQICLDNGRKPLLPPFEAPHSVRDVIQEKVKLEAAAVRDSGLEGDDISCRGMENKMSEEKADDSKHSGNGLILEGSAEIKLPVDASDGEIVGEKSSQCLSVTLGDEDGGRAACRQDDNIIIGNGNENDLGGIKTKTEEDVEFEGPIGEEGQRPEPLVGTLQATKPIASTEEEADREPKITCKTEYKDDDSKTESQQFTDQAIGQRKVKLPNSEISSKPRRKRTERSEIALNVRNGFHKCNKQANEMLTAEVKPQEPVDSCQKERRKQEHQIEQSKTDSGRTENFANSGSIPDGMIHKVCPVCRSFSSTSNTALNAHIDHCLDAEPSIEKTVTKFNKHKIKARKKRSMADICAVAPSRTLEDVQCCAQEQVAQEQLGRDLHPLELDEFQWIGGNIRRKRRTPISRAPKKYIECIDPAAKKLRNSSSLKVECLPNLHKESTKELPVSKDKDNGSRGTRKSKRSALTNLTRTSKRLNSHGFYKSDDKDSRTSAAEHIFNEATPQRKSLNASQAQDSTKEEKLSSSVNSTSWACFKKQGSSRRKKFRHKLVSLNLAGFGQRFCIPDNGVPLNVLEPKSQNLVGGSTLSEQGTLMGSKESGGGIISPLSDKGDSLPVIVSSKRSKAKQTRKGVANVCNSSGEVEEFFTSKRMKNLSNLNFQDTVTRGQSSFSETKLIPSGKFQSKQEVSFWHCGSNEEKRLSSHESDEISVNDTFNSQRPESMVAPKIVENEKRSSLRGTQSCQLKRDKSKERYSQNKNLLSSNTLKGPNSFHPSGGSYLKKSGLEDSYGVQKRQRHFKYNFGSPKMKKVAHIVHDLMNKKEVLKIDTQQTVHDTKINNESLEFIYDAGSTSNRAYSVKLGDCINTKAQFLFAAETYSPDGGCRSRPDLQPAAMSAGGLSTKPLETLVNAGHAEISGETQAQHDSTVYTTYEASKTPFQDGMVVIGKNEQNCLLKCTNSEIIGLEAGPLEACSNEPSYQQDSLAQGTGKNVTARPSLGEGKNFSEFSVSFQSQLNSCSEETLADLYLDDYLRKKDGFQRTLDGQSLSVIDPLEEKLSYVPLENQIPSDRFSSQIDVFGHESASVAAPTLEPLDRSPRAPNSDATIHIETTQTNISSVASISFQRNSTQELKPDGASAVSGETIVLSSDRIGLTPILNDAILADKHQVPSELNTEKAATTRPLLTSINEVSAAIDQSFELARQASGLSIQTSSSIITSTDLPYISQTSLLQGTSTLLEDSKTFDTSRVLPSVSMPQFVSHSLLSANSGKKSTVVDVLPGFVLSTSSHKHQSIPDGVCNFSNYNSALLAEKENDLKQTISSSLSSSPFGFMDGINGSCAGNSVHGFSSHVSGIPSHETGVHFGLELYPRICTKKISESNMVSSLGSDIATEPTDFSERLSSLGNANCSREPSIVHIFGNPIFRLMGKNVMLSSKDGTQSKPLEDSCIESSNAFPNQNYAISQSVANSLEFRTEAKLGQDGHGHIQQALERPRAFDPNMLQCFESRPEKIPNLLQPFEAEARDFGSFWHASDYMDKKTTDSENLYEAHAWNLAASACQSSIRSFLNKGQHPWITTTKSLPGVLPESMLNGVSHASADLFHHVQWQSSSTAYPHSDPEVIIIDDNVVTEASSAEVSFGPAILQRGSSRFQEDLLMSAHLMSNSKDRSKCTSLQDPNNLDHYSTEERRVTYGCNVPSARESPSELNRGGDQFSSKSIE